MGGEGAWIWFYGSCDERSDTLRKVKASIKFRQPSFLYLALSQKSKTGQPTPTLDSAPAATPSTPTGLLHFPRLRQGIQHTFASSACDRGIPMEWLLFLEPELFATSAETTAGSSTASGERISDIEEPEAEFPLRKESGPVISALISPVGFGSPRRRDCLLYRQISIPPSRNEPLRWDDKKIGEMTDANLQRLLEERRSKKRAEGQQLALSASPAGIDLLLHITSPATKPQDPASATQHLNHTNDAPADASINAD